MRIGFITSEFPVGGTRYGGLASYLGRVTSALADNGHLVHVITRGESSAGVVRLPNGVEVTTVVPKWHRSMWPDKFDRIVPRKLYNAYQDVKAAWCMWTAWRQLKRKAAFDIVQIANCQSTGLFLRFEREVPVVARVSNYRPECDRLGGYPRTMESRLRWWLEARSLDAARSIYTPSEFLAGELRSKMGFPEVSVIEPPFDPGMAPPNASECQIDPPFGRYVLHYGGLTQLKGTHIVVTAMRSVMTVDKSIEIVFIGRDGLATNHGSMVEFIRSELQSVSDRVHVHPPRSSAFLSTHIERASAVLIPSLYDNLPNTLLESMGMGKIVVATKDTCFDQLIEDGVNGYLATPSDSDSLARAIHQVLRMGDADRRRMGAAARRAIERFHPSKTVPKLIEYYEDVLTDFHGRKRLMVQKCPSAQ